MLIDSAPMHSVHVDPEPRIAQVAGRRAWGDVDHETQAFGLATPEASFRHRRRRPHPRRRLRLAAPQVRPLLRQPRRGPGGVRRRRGPYRSAGQNPDLFWAIRAAAATSASSPRSRSGCTRSGRWSRSRHLLPARGAREVLPGWRDYVSGAGRGHPTVVTITFPAYPEMPEAVHDRPSRSSAPSTRATDAGRGAAPLRELGTPLFDMSGPPRTSRCRPASTRCSRATTCGRTGSRSTSRSSATRRSPRRGPGAGPARAADAGNTFAHGRRDRGRSARRTPRSPSVGAVHGLDRRHVERPGRRRRERRVGARRLDAVGAYGTGEVYLNFTGLADEPRTRGWTRRSGATWPARRHQGALRPGQLLPGQQQHRPSAG